MIKTWLDFRLTFTRIAISVLFVFIGFKSNAQDCTCAESFVELKNAIEENYSLFNSRLMKAIELYMMLLLKSIFNRQKTLLISKSARSSSVIGLSFLGMGMFGSIITPRTIFQQRLLNWGKKNLNHFTRIPSSLKKI